MDAETVSVIIPSWNGAGLLPSCLNSLRSQTRQALEILVVDNASGDNSRDVVQHNFPEAQLIALARNLGYSGGVNAGIARAKGTLLAVLNQDVEADPRWIEGIVSAAESHPEAGAIACKILLHDRRDHFHSAGDGFRYDGTPFNRGVWQTDCGQYDTETNVFGACGGAAAYRRRSLDQVGWFDESLFMYLEDVDLAWRLQLAGWRATYAPRAVAFHRLGASGGGVTASYYTGRNTLYVLAKDVPGPLLRRHWRAITAAQWRVAIDAICAWRGTAARARLRGQIAGLLTWPRMLGKRLAIQSARRVSIEYLEALLDPKSSHATAGVVDPPAS